MLLLTFLPYISSASSLLVDTHPTAHHNYFKWSKISSMNYVFLQDQAPYCTRSTLWLIRIADMFTQIGGGGGANTRKSRGKHTQNWNNFKVNKFWYYKLCGSFFFLFLCRISIRRQVSILVTYFEVFLYYNLKYYVTFLSSTEKFRSPMDNLICQHIWNSAWAGFF